MLRSVLRKSPIASIETTAASSKGETKKALALCDRWCSTWWIWLFISPEEISKASANGLADPRARICALSLSITKPGFGRLLMVYTIFSNKWAIGSRENATWSIWSDFTPASLRQYRIDSEGKPAQCFIRRKRSSSTAATNSPSTYSAADESPWNALIPRIIIVRWRTLWLHPH